METRIRELESELDAENRRLADAQKNLRRSERRITELTFQQDEDRKNHERMQVKLLLKGHCHETLRPLVFFNPTWALIHGLKPVRI
jgi:hypothetical protein